MFKQYYFLSIAVGKSITSVFIEEDYVQWLCKQPKRNSFSVVMVKKITKKQYAALKAAFDK